MIGMYGRWMGCPVLGHSSSWLDTLYWFAGDFAVATDRPGSDRFRGQFIRCHHQVTATFLLVENKDDLVVSKYPTAVCSDESEGRL
jgi:hypothetical protein